MREPSPNPTTTCDHAPDVSALLDGELAPLTAPELVEHLLGCRSCATFFRRARALDAALLLGAAADDAGAEPSPPTLDLWERIASAARDERPAAASGHGARRQRRLPRWALPAAAALLLALGGLAGWQLSIDRTMPRRALGPGRDGVTFASLGTPPRMDERRFVAIARELLAADSRYRDAMTGVLAVARSEEPTEGSTAESSWREEELRGLRPNRPVIH